jgi:hypothetical protein
MRRLEAIIRWQSQVVFLREGATRGALRGGCAPRLFSEKPNDLLVKPAGFEIHMLASLSNPTGLPGARVDNFMICCNLSQFDVCLLVGRTHSGETANGDCEQYTLRNSK